MSVPVEVYNQTQIIWAVLTCSGIGAAVLTGVFWFIKNLMRTKSGKTIDTVKSQHKQLLLTATPSHRGNLFKVYPFSSRILQTTKFDNRVKRKRKEFYEAEQNHIALQISELTNAANLSEEEKKKRLALTQECIDFVVEGNREKVYLEDSVPLTVAVEDRTVTCGIKGLGAMGYIEKLFAINGLKDKIASLEETPDFKDVAAYLKNLASQITPIDFDLLRSYFPADWDQSDDESQKEYYYTMGFRDGRTKEKGIEKIILYAGIAVGILGIVGGAVLAFLGK